MRSNRRSKLLQVSAMEHVGLRVGTAGLAGAFAAGVDCFE